MKTKLFLTLAAALALTACSNEDLVHEVTATSQSEALSPLTFDIHTQNQTRSTVALNTIHTTFGVWAEKNSSSATTTFNPVSDIQNMKVEYDNNKNIHGSKWLYDGGNAKYWDNDATRYNFYAYAPHATSGVSFNSTDKKITFPEMSAYTAAAETNPSDYMFANKATAYKTTVGLTFKRLRGKVRLAFYSDITGYRVKFNSDITVAAADRGSVVNKATPVVTLSGDSPSVAWTVASLEGTATSISFTKPSGDDTNGYIATSNPACLAADNNSVSPTYYYCLPTGTTTAPDLVLSFTYDLYNASDNTVSNSAVNASVTIPAAHTVWAENTIYTYIFKITNSMLTPIVFDNILYEEYTEYDANSTMDGVQHYEGEIQTSTVSGS